MGIPKMESDGLAEFLDDWKRIASGRPLSERPEGIPRLEPITTHVAQLTAPEFCRGPALSDELDAAAVAEYEAHQADVAREGDGTLLALAIAAEIAVDDHRLNRRTAREALAETQVALYRPGRVFA